MLTVGQLFFLRKKPRTIFFSFKMFFPDIAPSEVFLNKHTYIPLVVTQYMLLLTARESGKVHFLVFQLF